METGIHPDALLQLGRRFFGNQVDNATRRAHPMNGVSAVQHLHSLNHVGVDGIALAPAIAQRVGLWYPINHIQRLASAQGFTAVGHLLATGRKTGNQVAQHRGQIVLN